MPSYWRRGDVMASHRRQHDVICLLGICCKFNVNIMNICLQKNTLNGKKFRQDHIANVNNTSWYVLRSYRLIMIPWTAAFALSNSFENSKDFVCCFVFLVSTVSKYPVINSVLYNNAFMTQMILVTIVSDCMYRYYEVIWRHSGNKRINYILHPH